MQKLIWNCSTISLKTQWRTKEAVLLSSHSDSHARCYIRLTSWGLAWESNHLQVVTKWATEHWPVRFACSVHLPGQMGIHTVGAALLTSFIFCFRTKCLYNWLLFSIHLLIQRADFYTERANSIFFITKPGVISENFACLQRFIPLRFSIQSSFPKKASKGQCLFQDIFLLVCFWMRLFLDFIWWPRSWQHAEKTLVDSACCHCENMSMLTFQLRLSFFNTEARAPSAATQLPATSRSRVWLALWETWGFFIKPGPTHLLLL